MGRTCPDEAIDELRRRALEPFRPTRTMDDVLRREAEIREASIACQKEEARKSRERLRSKDGKTSSEWKRIDCGLPELERCGPLDW